MRRLPLYAPIGRTDASVRWPVTNDKTLCFFCPHLRVGKLSLAQRSAPGHGMGVTRFGRVRIEGRIRMFDWEKSSGVMNRSPKLCFFLPPPPFETELGSPASVRLKPLRYCEP
jgi:hypothetical protein